MEKERQEKERIEEWIDKLNASGDIIIIVEGKKDKKSLMDSGVTADIVTLKRPIFETAEGIAESGYKKAIILTDFDRKGKELYGKLSKELSRNGIRVDNYFREFLQKNTKLSHIEGMKKYLNNL